ncbi:unnamed protein product, partial [Iphiclides podalirius]
MFTPSYVNESPSRVYLSCAVILKTELTPIPRRFHADAVYLRAHLETPRRAFSAVLLCNRLFTGRGEPRWRTWKRAHSAWRLFVRL